MRGLYSIMIFFIVWQIACVLFKIPDWLLPAPTSIALALVSDFSKLFSSLLFTAKVTAVSLFLAVVTGVVLGVLSYISKNVREGLYPFTILLQTTPVVSVAPLLIVWFKNNAFAALVSCAWLVCVYPMISSTLAGLHSADPNLKRLFSLYRISPWKSLLHLEIPSSLPMILNGFRISGGLALVGAIGAEFVAGTGGQELGLAYRLLMAAYNQETARLFAALFVVSVFGIAIHLSLALFESYMLKHLRRPTPGVSPVA